MRIGLYGIGGVYNFGCEAIVRGAYKLIKKLYPNAQIIYFSYSPEYDKKALFDLDIKIFPVQKSRNLFKRLVNKALQLMNANKRILMMNFNAMMAEVDCIWSIGGDIYTIPAVARKNRTYSYYNELVNFCDSAIAHGKYVVAYGASVGPFGEYTKAIQYYRSNLLKYNKIVCREYKTINYLEKIGVDNTMFLPDPALQMKDLSADKNTDKKYIGINLSPLSLNEIYGNHSVESIKKLASTLKTVYDKLHVDMLFIPHVISSDENDDDLRFLISVKSYMPTELQQHVKLANYSGGFLGIKEQLRQCYFIVSARMHCAVNAIDENIPAIFISYSQKSIGMCEYIYGSDEWLLDIKRIEDDGIQRIVKMMDECDEVASYLVQRNLEIQSYYEEHYVKILD